jgi:hypothetical protein
MLEDIPQSGQQLKVGDLLFTVRSVSRKKVLEVEVRRVAI